MPTVLELVKEQKELNSDLYQRMDADKDLLYLKKYIIKDLDNKPFQNIINVTLNDPAVFAANVISSLGSTSQQIVVESDNKRLDTAYIEEFQKAAINSANERLRKQGKALLNSFLDEQFCIRGAGAVLCLFRMGENGLIPDLTPWDTRHVSYDMGEDGLEWASYETARNSRSILLQYPGISLSKEKGIDVIDFWDKEHHEVWIEKKQAFEEPHTYGYTPVVIQKVSLGSMLGDEDSLAHQGESIFFLIRDLMPELNRLASILQSINMKTASQALTSHTREGTQAEPPKHEKVTAPGAMTSYGVDEGLRPVPIDDIKRSATLLYSIMEQRIQRGSLSSTDLGTLQFPLSAVALVEIGEGRDQVFLPRLQSKALENQGLAEMFTNQVLQIGQSIELGTMGHKRTFEIGKLEGEYETTYKYFVKSPKIDIARYSVATAAERYLDEDTILRDVLQLEDPDGVKQKRYYDLAAKISPAVLRKRVIESLIDQDEMFEARIMAKELGMELKQILAGEIPKVPEQAPAQPPLIPLMGKGGERTSARKAVELKQTPQEEAD